MFVWKGNCGERRGKRTNGWANINYSCDYIFLCDLFVLRGYYFGYHKAHSDHREKEAVVPYAFRFFALNDQVTSTRAASCPSGSRPSDTMVKLCASSVSITCWIRAATVSPVVQVKSRVWSTFLKNCAPSWVTSIDTGGCCCKWARQSKPVDNSPAAHWAAKYVERKGFCDRQL